MNLSNNLSIKILDISQSLDYKWYDAIRGAESETESLTKQTRRLQQAVRIFKANKRDAIP